MHGAWQPACLLLADGFFGQQFDGADLLIVGLLILLEGVLSIDNALVLGLLARRLPKEQQSRALTYGLVGAFVFRLLAIGTATFLLEWRFVKLLGGGYLVYIAVKHMFFEQHEKTEDKVVLDASGEPQIVHADDDTPLTPEERELEIQQRTPLMTGEAPEVKGGTARFWPTVFVIEMTDIAFAVDSILAAVGVVGKKPADLPVEAPHPKLWVVLVGGMLGVVLMRFAAVVFIKLLERFPRFEHAAYLLVTIIGGKLLADWGFNTEEHPHRLDFHDWHSPAFWAFWGLMIAAFCVGFVPKRKSE